MEWIPRKTNELPGSATIKQLSEQLEISPMLLSLLWSRGLDTPSLLDNYLSPRLKNLSSLEKWEGLTNTAEIIATGLTSGENFAVWGDYDVDGITSTALVKEFITAHGFSCQFHIPNRIEEGYGLNKESITQLHERGVTMLLTVDSGITDVGAVAHAKKLGMKIIISDHHLASERLPEADAIVNPRLDSCPCPTLAGVGVAFFLMAAVNVALAEKGYQKYDIRNLLDLVALGTLADVVELSDQNRILVKNGLLLIEEGRRPGIAALKNICNFSPTASLGAGQVVFMLTPRINAAGRLGSSYTALSLLLAKDIQEASDFAKSLETLNNKRREEEESILQAAKEQAEKQDKEGRTALVLYDATWHQGVIGIVASRIMETFNKPVVVLTKTGSFLKGSGRSISGFDMHDGFARCSQVLLGSGGHKMAAGLSLNEDKLQDFSDLFNAIAEESLGKGDAIATCKIDAELPLEFAADFTVLKELELMQPFGNANAEPVFVSPPVLVKSIMFRPNFCMFDVAEKDSGIVLKAKAWRNTAATIPKDIKGKYIILAYSPRIDRYNGIASVELRVKDWKLVEDVSTEFMKIPFTEKIML